MVPTAPALPEHWPLFGRSVELERAIALATAPGSSGVAVHGPAGVGRSRFLAEVVAALAQSGRHVIRTVATVSASSIPLGALAHLLPHDDVTLEDDWSASLDATRALGRALESLTAVSGLILTVDDAHLLDPLSLILLQHLCEVPSARIVVSVCSDEREPDGLSALWRTGRLVRIDLDALDVETVDELLHRSLLGAVDGRATRLLHQASGGMPLLLREQVRTAVDEEVLVRLDGVWRLNGPLPTVRRTIASVSSVLVELDQASRDLLELLALTGPTPLELVETEIAAATLESMETGGLIAVRDSVSGGGRFTVEIAHRGLADAMGAEILPLRRRAILSAHANRYEAWSGGSDADELAVARWRLDAGVQRKTAELEHAATLARSVEDFAAAARFAEAADRIGGTLRSGLLWGDALYDLSQWAECERVFLTCYDRPGNPLDRLRLVTMRAANLLFGLMRGEEALRLSREALAEFDAGHSRWTNGLVPADLPAMRVELVSLVANQQMYNGDPGAAVRTLGPMPPAVISTDESAAGVRHELRARVLWALPGVPATAFGGRTKEAAAAALSAIADHQRLGTEVGMAFVGTHLLTLGIALQEQGDFDQANTMLMMGYEGTLSGGVLLGQIWFALSLARTALLTGHPVTGERWIREVLAATKATGWMGPRYMALNGLAACRAMLGDVDGAQAALGEAQQIGNDFRFMRPERVLGSAYTLAASGRLEEGRDQLLDGAKLAGATGHLTIESALLFEAVRISGGAEEVTRLDELATNSDSPLLRARANYVSALLSGEPTELEATARAIEGFRCDLAASELYGAAEEALRAKGLPRPANAIGLLAAAATSRSEGARSFRLSRVITVSPLSAREREVAGLAADGVPSKEIAQRLHLSVRTVTNHLQNVYTKLGVTSRADVAEVLKNQR